MSTSSKCSDAPTWYFQPIFDGEISLYLLAFQYERPCNSWEHVDICKLIIGNITDKHPMNNAGKTPKDLALEYENEDILKIVDV